MTVKTIKKKVTTTPKRKVKSTKAKGNMNAQAKLAFTKAKKGKKKKGY